MEYEPSKADHPADHPMHERRPLVRCGAKTRDGDPCKLPPVTGRTRCRMHGGRVPQGIGLTATLTGRYSKHLPTRLAARYHEAEADPDLLNLRGEISLTDTRLADVLARVDTGESGRLWRTLRETHTALIRARVDRDDAAVQVHMRALGDLIGKGFADTVAWSEIAGLIDQRRRLVESERKRLIDMQQMLTVERAMALLGAVVEVVRRHVTDPKALRAVAEDLTRLIA